MAPSDAPRRLTLKPTELQPRGTQSTLPALTELREDIVAIGHYEPADPMFAAHISMALLKIGKRLDDLEARCG